MHHRLTHDDRIRILRSTLPENSAHPAEFLPIATDPDGDRPVQHHRAVVNRASLVYPTQLAWRRRAAGSIRGLRKLMRELKR